MHDISCDVCMDLMPLVQDGIASADSRALVEAHIAHCAHCLKQQGQGPQAQLQMDESAVLRKIKMRLTLLLSALVFAGALLGMAVLGGMDMFYNALIMPAIGALGYVLLRRRAYLAPVAIFVFAGIWVAVREIADGFLTYSGGGTLVAMAVWWAGILAAFAAVGVLIARLLHFAFGKEEEKR